MSNQKLTMVRIYLTESEHHARKLLDTLHDAGIRGATLLRGISGFGGSGRLHEVGFADLVGDLPLILEFVDTMDKVDAVLPILREMSKPGHVLRWPVELCEAPAEPAPQTV